MGADSPQPNSIFCLQAPPLATALKHNCLISNVHFYGVLKIVHYWIAVTLHCIAWQ